jgi:hypothetical protein
MAKTKQKLNKFIDAIIDIIIDSYLQTKSRKPEEKYDIVNMNSTTDRFFDGRLGQSESVRLSSPGRPLKLYGKESDIISKVQ